MAFEFPGWPRQSTPAGHCACPPLRPLVVLIEVAVILMPGDSVGDAGANYQAGWARGASPTDGHVIQEVWGVEGTVARTAKPWYRSAALVPPQS